MILNEENYKEDVEVIGQAFDDNAYSPSDFSIDIDGDVSIKVLDKVRILSRLSEFIESNEAEFEMGLELVKKYLNGKQIRFYLNGKEIGNIVYDSKVDFDIYPVFVEYPILLKVLCSRMLGYASKNSIGCLVNEKCKPAQKTQEA